MSAGAVLMFLGFILILGVGVVIIVGIDSVLSNQKELKNDLREIKSRL